MWKISEYYKLIWLTSHETLIKNSNTGNFNLENTELQCLTAVLMRMFFQDKNKILNLINHIFITCFS